MNLNLFFLRSLKTRVTLFTLLIFLISIWSLALYASRMLREDMQVMLGEQQFSMVSLVANQVNAELDDRQKALKRVAEEITPALMANTEALQYLLEHRPIFQDLFNGGILVLGPDGTAMAQTPQSEFRIGVNYMEVDSVISALKEGKSVVGRPVVGKTLKTPVFNLIAPIRDVKGQVVGALMGVINLSKPNFLDKITHSNYGKTGGYLLTAPQHRLFVTATDKSRIMQPTPATGLNPLFDRYMQGEEGYGVSVSSRGVEELTAVKGIPVAGWFMGLVIPTEEVFAPIRAIRLRMMLATILLTLLAGALTWWMISRMLRHQFSPMLAAARTLVALSESNQPTPLLPVARQDEIGELISSFNSLLQTLGQREATLKQILDTSSVAIFLLDQEGRITQANQRMAEMFSCTLDELQGNEYVALLHPDERENGQQNMLSLLGGKLHSVELDRLYWRFNQTKFWGHLTGQRFYDANGAEHGLIGVIADISDRKQADENLHLAASVFSHAREAIMITAADGVIVDVNAAFTRITGYQRDEVVGRNPRILSSGRQGPEFYSAMWHGLREKGHWYGEVWNRRKNGEVFAEMQTISTVQDDKGKPQHYVAMFSDISALKAHQSQLEHIAHYDALTSLPNRVLLADRLHQAMTLAQRRGQLLAVAYLDLDGFKSINDHHGHEAGDQLLIALAGRMKLALRDGDTLARLGGDEFVAVLLDLKDSAACVPMLNRLLTAAAQGVHVGEAQLQVSASLGVTFYPQADEVDADQLLRQADQAMYQAKLAGKNRFHIFDAEQDRSVRGHHESVERIRNALRDQELVLYYQPKVNMRTGVVIGAEALIRWQHPDKGLLAPGVFLPVIEDHPLAVDVGEWVLNTALTQMTQWRACGLNIPVSVNVGARQLQQADFVLRLREILAAHPTVRPGDLELEVLETSALEDLVHVSQLIESCRELGVTFALDDFGTGYSSLTYLKRLPVTLLKIDQSFVHDMLDNPDDLAILEGVIGLASAFRRQVIAEGVETVAHGALLLQLGCELAQGYGIARPMPAANLPDWAAHWHTDPAWADLPAVKREDLPLLFASAEHRAWVAAIETYINGDREALPPMAADKSRFGQWLASEGVARYGAQSSFQAIDPLHQKIHSLSGELLAFHAQGQQPEMLQRLHELHALRDVLLAQLKMVLREQQL